MSKIIESLDVDLIGLQEVDDTTLCRQMIDNLPGYELFIADGWFGGLAYVYKTSGWAMTLTSILTLHGCTVLPSTQIPGADVISMSGSNNNTINLIPVTPRLISEMHSQKAWVVQAASFLDEDKAEAMQQALKAKGFSVFRNDIRKHDQNHHRVFIGPKSDKRIAQAFSKYVDSLFG